MNIKDIDTSSLRYDPADKKALKQLRIDHKDVFTTEMYVDQDLVKHDDEILRYIILVYDINSPLRKTLKTHNEVKVQAMLLAGFDVKDLGVDVSPSRFIEEAEDMSADIIACSALMSTTVSVQKDVIEFLKAQGFRDTYKVLVGGGVVSRDYAEVIGADGYGMTANEAIGVAKKLLGKQ